MTSNLSCVGLGISDDSELAGLVARLDDVTLLGETGTAKVTRWQDASGARLVVTYDRDGFDITPSFAGEPGARLAGVTALNDDVVSAAVVDEDGEQLTGMAFELEQRRFLTDDHVTGYAGITALGVDVTVHADEAAFAASDASLLQPAGSADSAPPAEFVERGWPWPPRMASESFLSYGIFGEPADASAYARLAGTVLHARQHTVALTGQEFVAARVRTAGFEATVCMAAADHPAVPQVGEIIAGTVFLVACLDAIRPGPGA